jgi:hypothetical protein
VFLDYYLKDSGGYDVPGHPYAGLVVAGLQTGQQNAWMAVKRTEQNYSFGA